MAEVGPDQFMKVYPGVAIKMFDLPIMNSRTRRNDLFFNVKGKGLFTVTGCCHMGIMNMLAWAERNIEGQSPTDAMADFILLPSRTGTPNSMTSSRGKEMSFRKSHATTARAGSGREGKAEGLPIVLGTQKYKEYKKIPTTGPGAKDNVYLRNGDTIVF